MTCYCDNDNDKDNHDDDDDDVNNTILKNRKYDVFCLGKPFNKGLIKKS